MSTVDGAKNRSVIPGEHDPDFKLFTTSNILTPKMVPAMKCLESDEQRMERRLQEKYELMKKLESEKKSVRETLFPPV